MKAVDRRWGVVVRHLALSMSCIMAAGPMAALARAQNTGARLTDGDATFDYTAGGANALPTLTQGATGNVPMNFQITGTPGDPLEQQIVSGNWFYRIVGDNRERHFANAVARNTAGSDYVQYAFDPIDVGSSSTPAGDVWAEMDFKVFDTGPDSALLSTQVCFHNRGQTTVDIEVFLAVDFHLAATAANDAYAPLNTSGGRMWTLTDGGYTGLMWGPNAVGADAGTSSSIMGGMTNSSPTNYSTGPHPGGTFPDGAAGLQFHVTLPPGPTTICSPAYIGIGANGVIPPLEVPEPGSLALLGSGAAVALVRQWRRR